MIEHNQKGMMLLDNACGMISMMSSLSLNMYNHIILMNQNQKLSSLFYEMMLSNMKYLHLFLQLSYHLGMEPRLWTCYCQHNEYWSPSYNNYHQSFDSLMDNVIESKKVLIDKFNLQLKSIHDPDIIKLLKSVIKEENKYLTLLSSFINTDS